MATIEKRASSGGGKPSYRVKVRVRGFPPETASFSRLTDAKEWAATTESDMKAGRYFGGARRHTFNELADEYEQVAKELKTAYQRLRHLNLWRAEFGPDLLSDITQERINKVRARLLTEKTYRGGLRSGPTVNRALASLSACFGFAIKSLGWMERNPCARVQKSRESTGRVRFLTEQEITSLLDACRPHPDLYLAVVLSRTTGARQSEIMLLRWPQIDFARRVITLSETKNGQSRALPLSGEAFTILQERAKVRSLHDDRIFPPTVKAKKSDCIDLRVPWLEALKAAEIKNFRWHDMRHTAASHLAMSGVSLTEIAKILGHRTLAMVARYSHLSDSHIVKTGDALAARMGLGG